MLILTETCDWLQPVPGGVGQEVRSVLAEDREEGVEVSVESSAVHAHHPHHIAPRQRFAVDGEAGGVASPMSHSLHHGYQVGTDRAPVIGGFFLLFRT